MFFQKYQRINLKTTFKNKKTILEVYTLQPLLKLMTPFYKKDDYIKVVVMSSSAGIMAGDRQEYNINVGENTKLELTSQSYEKSQNGRRKSN